MADSGRIEGNRVLCHECQHEWDRAHGGLTCPSCGGEFTEILETPAGPELRQPPPPPVPRHPFHDHHPWGDDVPDPDEGDINQFADPAESNIRTFEFGGGRGTITVQSSTRTFGGNGRNNRSGLHNHQDDFPQMPAFPFPFSQTTGGMWGGTFQMDGRGGSTYQSEIRGAPTAGNMQDIFGALFQTLNNAQVHRQGNQPGPLPDAFTMLRDLFAGRQGDTVFTDQAFDQVMTQLMEQNNGSTAPGPASADALDALPTEPVDETMMGHDGKAECSICMINVEIGDDVTYLPCKHWFHGECVKMWLVQHDSCPQCRAPITPAGEQGPTPPRSQRPSRSFRRPSSVSSPRTPPDSSSRRAQAPAPYNIPNNPSAIREARQQFYSRRRNSGDEMAIQRTQSGDDTSRPENLRSASTTDSAGAGGGVGGWIRNHNPFSG